MKKEIINKFKDKPKTKTTYWAMWYGLSAMFILPILGIFTSVVRPILDPASVNPEELFGAN